MPATLLVRILEDITLSLLITTGVIWAYGSTERGREWRGKVRVDALTLTLSHRERESVWITR
jgi:hypothetical protein